MAKEKKPSIYADRGTIGSAHELDEYGVWVKSEPQDLTAIPQAAQSELPSVPAAEPDTEDEFPDLDIPDMDELPEFDDTTEKSAEEVPEIPNIEDGESAWAIEDLSAELKDLTFDENEETAEATQNAGEPDFSEIKLDDLDEAFESAGPADLIDLTELENSAEPMTENARPDDSGESLQSGSPAGEPASEKTSNQQDLSTLLLQRIAEELSSIRTELSSLKRDFSNIKAQADAEEPDHRFLKEEDDEKIALTGDELDNILNTADFTEETGTDPTNTETQDLSSGIADDDSETFSINDLDGGLDLDMDSGEQDSGTDAATAEDDSIDLLEMADLEEPFDLSHPSDVSELADLEEPLDLSEPIDLSEPSDLSHPADLIEPSDLEEPVDLEELPDLSEPVDLAEPLDLSHPADLAEPADLSHPADLEEPADLIEPLDLSEPADLAEHFDLSEPSDLEHFKKTQPVDLAGHEDLIDHLDLSEHESIDLTAGTEHTIPDLIDDVPEKIDFPDFEEEAGNELLELRDKGAEPMTPAPEQEDTDYLDTDPMADEELGGIWADDDESSDTAVHDEILPDLSEAVIEEPDLSTEIQDNPIEEPSLENISIDLEMEDTDIPEDDETAAEADFSEDSLEIPAAGQNEEDDLALIPEGFVVENPENPLPETADDIPEAVFETDEPGLDDTAAAEIPIMEKPVDSADINVIAEGNIPTHFKQELKSILSYMDKLLESLPDSKIEEFAKSEYFDTYKKLFKELGLV